MRYPCYNFQIKTLKTFEGRSYEKNVRNNDLIDCFYDFLSRENSFRDEDLITNKNLQNFVLSLNKLNIYSWAGKYESYKNSLKNETLVSMCEDAHNFFVLNFRG